MPPLDRQEDLFAAGPAAPVDVAPAAAEWRAAAEALDRRIRFGTSSWTFEGWAGRVWDREVRGEVLARSGLAAYARHPLLRAVAVDRTYYQPVPAPVYRAWADQVPSDFRFVVKADRRLVFPDGPGSEPDLFLNPVWASDEIVGPTVEGLGRRLAVLLFQFPPMPAERLGGPRAFAEKVYRFLSGLPADLAGRARVEVRTPDFLGPDQVEALRHAGAGHGFVVHPEMPSLPEQWARMSEVAAGPVDRDRDRTVLMRWMLQPGYHYTGAMEAWSPFDRVRRPDPEARAGIVDLIGRGRKAGGSPLLIVNNKAEGCAPGSIEEIASALVGGG